VNPIRVKESRLQLDADVYQQMGRHVYRWDGWKCQGCGTRHTFRSAIDSQPGDHSEENLITLCTACHDETHLVENEVPDQSITD
jgi:5-methylcytosine-specific restriction endonuclease McrA